MRIWLTAIIITGLGVGAHAQMPDAQLPDAQLPVAPPEQTGFRVDTVVVDLASSKPVAKIATIFDGAIIYDLRIDTGTVTIFYMAPQHQKCVLLDPARTLKAELSTLQLFKLVAQMPKTAGAGELTEQKNVSAMKVAVGDSRVHYEVQAAAANSRHFAAQFRLFADNMARLNALPPNRSAPFARLRINHLLVEEQWVPVAIQKTIQNGETPLRLESRHEYQWQLGAQEKGQIAEIHRQLDEAVLVNFNEYLNLP